MSDTLERKPDAPLESKRDRLRRLLEARAQDKLALPLSFAQERLWFLQQLEPDSSLYNVSGAVRLSGALDVRALEAALDEVRRRHDVLRTVFRATDGRPLQKVLPAAPLPLPPVSLAEVEPAHRDEQVRRLAEEEARRPFDLERGPLLRATLLGLGPTEHVLLLTMHHIVSDGWSQGLLVRELGALYAAFRERRPSPLPPLPLQYSDFAVWQRKTLQGERLDSELAYWAAQLGGAPAALELPTDRPRPPSSRHAGARHTFSLPRAVAEGLNTLARREGATLFMALLGVWKVLLHRYSGQEELVVGTPIANRNRSELEGLIGFFVNTLALRSRVSDGLSFTELLARVRETTLAAYAHQDVPFEKVVERVSPARDLSRSPLFQVMFVLQNAPAAELALPGVRLSLMVPNTGTSQFDLTLALEETPAGLEGSLEYDVDLFDASTIAGMARHFGVLCEAVVAEPRRALGRLPLMRAEERRAVFEGSAGPRRAYGEDVIHRAFERQVARTPDAVAVEAGGERLTYRELNARANRVARLLRSLGVGPEARVGVCLERSFEMVTALLGTLKAGGAYVPVDPLDPAERLAFMLADAKVSVLLVTAASAGRVPPGEAKVVRLDADATALAAFEDTDLPDDGGPDALAYAIFTSGSTGRPKAAMNPHRGVMNRLAWQQERFGLGPADAVLQKTPFTFDVSVWELFHPLLAGARLVMARPEGHKDPAYLAEVLEAAGITHAHFVPSMLDAFLEAQPDGFQRAPRLRRVVCSGEALSARLQARFFAASRAELHNFYGPTEAAVDVTAWACRSGEARASVPIGVPVANTRMYILDRHLEPVPEGVPGALYIAGVQVGRGYLGRPELTAERFMPEPFGAGGGARMYWTGDLARWKNGAIEFLGRLDHQVKLRGFRIELGEIEATLAKHPGVRQCAVVVRDTAAGDKALVAYVVRTGPGTAAADWRDFLRQSLPAHMVPSAVVFLDALPLTPSGKLDRRALPAPELDRRDGDRFEAPRGEVEEAIAAIWAGLLGRSDIGRNDDFFLLGGHSLLATRVASALRTKLEVELPLRVLFEAPRLSGLAEEVARARQAAHRARQPPVLPVPRSGPLPLSFAQARLWFLDRFDPENGHAYNVSLGVRIRGALEPSRFARAVQEVVRRHEALRTSFPEVDGQPVQVISPPAAVPVPVEELRGLDAADAEARVLARAAEEARTRFDLAQGPLLRVRLLRLGAESWVCLLALHHIVTDGWSLTLLVRELAECYAALGEGRAPALVPLPVQYADFAAWQRDWLRGEALERQLAFWRQRLAEPLPLLDLPTDRPRPSQQTFRGAVHRFELGPEQLRGLRRLGQGERATLSTVLLAAFGVLLHRHCGLPAELLVGTPIAGRNRSEIEGLIGFFVNTLVQRLDLSANPTFRELLARTRASVLEAQTHQDVPFEKLVEALQPARDPSRPPFFQVLFDFHHRMTEPLALGELTLEPFELHNQTAKFDLSLEVEEAPERLGLELEYNLDLFDPPTIERLAGHLTRLLEAFAREPDGRVGHAAMLPDAELSRLLVEGNRTRADWDTEVCFPELFEAQVARTPDAVAALCDGETLTYEALDRRANQVGHALLEAGVALEDRVPLLMDRGLDYLVALLGVLKSGGAFVPLDASQPRARVEGMLRGTAPRAVLCEARHRALAEALAPPGVRVLELSAVLSGPARSEPPPRRAHPKSLAYVIFTSGSTGVPKGAMIEHRGMLNHLRAKVHDLGITAADRVAQTSTHTFDVSVWQLLSALLVGGRVSIFRDDSAWEPTRLLAKMTAERVTLMETVPSHMILMLDELEQRPGAYDLSAMRWFFLNGEALLPQLCARWFALYPRVPMINSYGATEASDDTVHFHVLSPPPLEWRYLPIHGNLPNLTAYVLDGNLEPVPFGVPGEMYIGGIGVGRGYHGDPEKTARSYVPDLYGDEPGARMYRTGDRVRALPDGSIEFLGRVDHQVKIRGHRVEIGEVENTLALHPAVRECVVVAQDVRGDEKRLFAYVVFREPTGASARELAEFLGARLADYLVPSAFVTLEALPLLPNGKVNRKALPKPTAAGEGTQAYVPPRTPVEETIARVWSELLGVEQVGRTADFFELGGHSLLAIQTLSRLRGALGVELSVRGLFEARTVEEIARRVEDRERGPAGSNASSVFAALPLEKLSPREEYALAAYQLPEWFMHELEPQSAFYNISFADILFEGDLDVDAFVRAWQVLVDRHAAFRTTFGYANGKPVQRIGPKLELTREDIYVDRTGVPEAEVEAELQRLATRFTSRPFDFERGPMFQVKLAELPGKRFFLIFHTHHILWDETSTMNLSRELCELYNAQRAGRAPVLPPLPLDYADFAHWINRAVEGGHLEGQRRYWLERFRPLPPVLNLPTDYPRPSLQTFNGAEVEELLPRRLRAPLEDFLKGRQVTLNIFLLAVLDVLLHRLTGQEDIVVGTPFANRGDEKLEPVLGLFATALPIRCEVRPDLTFEALLSRVRERSLEAFDNHLYPSVLAIQELNPNQDLSRNRLFSVMYGLQNDKTRLFSESSFDGVRMRFLPGIEVAEGGTAKFDLTFVVDYREDDLVLRLNYNTDLFLRETAERMVAQFFRLTEQVLEEPARPLSTYRMLSDAEARRVLSDFNETALPIEGGQTVPCQLEAQASRTPDAVALVGAFGRMTYRELDEAANRWARQLIAAGAGVEDKVALLLPPCAELVVAALAVLKAGASYVPINPEDPPERQELILRAAGAKALVTTPERARATVRWDGRVLDTSTLARDAGQHPPTRPEVALRPRNRAYVLFTSGTTGTPKGIEIEHRGVVNVVASAQARYRLTAADTVLFITPFSFDAAVLDVFWPLATGARLAIPEPGELRNPAAIARRVNEHGVTVLQSVPILLSELVDGVRAGGVPAMPSLRQVLCGGAALGRPLRDRFAAAFRCALANHYGPTEVTVDASQFDCAQPFRGELVPIGKPVANARLHVLDPRGAPTPIGVVGELHVASPGLARGYLDDPARTALAFVPDPFSPEPGGRLYRTGDLGRYDADGNVHFLGRVDKQLKIRGNRVEVEEIEARLAAHPAVSRASVQPGRAGAGHEGLVAYVELKDRFSVVEERGDRYRLFTLAQRPELKPAMDRLHAEAWPEYFVGDSTLRRHWPRLATEVPELQYGLLDEEDRLLAVGNAVPIRWDGTVAGLPAGWDDGLERGLLDAERGVAANTFLILTGVVAQDAQGRGLATVVLKAFKTLARAHRFERVIVAVRPNGKAERPELSFEDYCALRRPDGSPEDNWLRSHERVGGRVLKLEPRSQHIRARLEDWEKWAGQRFTRSGEYQVKDTLQPVRIDVTGGYGEYYDPSIWFEHPASAGGDYPWEYVDGAALREHLRALLPEYMIPQQLRFVPALPLTSAGKVDERALAALGSGVAGGEPRLPPRNATQTQLAELWKAVLGVDEVGIRDDFFALGGHSIRAVQLLAKVAEQFHAQVPLREFYREPTISALERHLGTAVFPAVEVADGPREREAPEPRVGFGTAPGHHGELLQGVFEAGSRRLQRGLVTLPCDMLKSEAVFTPQQGAALSVEPAWKVKAGRAAELALAWAGAGGLGGRLELHSNIPVGWGLGSSTSDVVAAIRAVAHALRRPLPAAQAAELAVKAEQASDAIMFPERVVLFAHRKGEVLEELAGPLPPLEVLGFNTDPTGAGIDTLKLPRARYASREIESFRVMMGLLRRAIRTQDPSLLGRVATASARISQAHLPKPAFERLLAIAEMVGAVGVQVAHSGTVAGLLFDGADPKREGGISRARAMVSELGFGQLRRFRTGPEQ